MKNNLELNSTEVARHIAHLCSENGYEYNNTKIQKLLYICYGIFLAKDDVRLVEEQPQAWPYGPVFPRVFSYINKSKEDYKRKMNFGSENVESELREIIKCFGSYTAGKLSAWSHIAGSPWEQVISDDDEPPQCSSQWSKIIPDKIIKNYFKEKVIKNAQGK